jgi:hypothetical protein
MIVSVQEYDGQMQVSVLPDNGGTCDFTALKEVPAPTGEMVKVWRGGGPGEEPRDKKLTRCWWVKVPNFP